MERRPDITSAETVALPEGAAARPSSSSGSRLSKVSSTEEGRFVAGTLLGGRYRIIGLLGEGGMGEVYRATDLTLGQSVALKFLPEAAAGNERLLERFQGEVRVARQVSHPNVCRVYDIGEVEGLPFISMEYVDGEDLASLLKRIGRLPADKALEVARKICAGLAAAHDKGVIHRDLKPQNVMMNKRGEVLIMDFGLAAIASQLSGREARNGTPAYMSPEQLKGTEVSARSDLYALGLVLYELFTGRRPYEASSIPQLLEMQESAQLTSMSSIAADIDPSVEKAIRRCLDPDPAKRPATAISVAAALPGGDPLAAALAAGETPSPDLVAAAGTTEGLDRRYALACLGVILACLVAVPFIRQQRLAFHRAPLEYPPEVLRVKAREIAASFGYPDKPGDTALWMIHRRELLRQLNDIAQKHGQNWDAWLAAESPISAFYRESSSSLIALPWGNVDSNNPAPIEPGMMEVEVDGAGRLRGFSAMPLPPGKDLREPVAIDAVFRAAQLDKGKFAEAPPGTVPRGATDTLHAWKGPHPVIPDTELTVEIGSWQGRVTYARFIWPWQKEDGAARAPASRLTQVRGVLIPAMVTIGTIFGILLARRNWKAGRVDRRGAMRLAIANLVLIFLFWAGWMHFVPAAWIALVRNSFADAVFGGAFTWLLYLALEPALRARWPQSIVTWNRVLKGQWKDAQVWAHILIGAAVGVLSVVLISIREVIAIPTEGLGVSGSLGVLLGARQWAGLTFLRAHEALESGLMIFFVIFGLRIIFRKDWIAALVGALLLAATEGNVQSAASWQMAYGVYVLDYAVFMFILLRLGLVVTIAGIFFMNTIGSMTLGTDWTAWYTPNGVAILGLILGIGGYAFWRALGTRDLLGNAEDRV